MLLLSQDIFDNWRSLAGIAFVVLYALAHVFSTLKKEKEKKEQTERGRAKIEQRGAGVPTATKSGLPIPPPLPMPPPIVVRPPPARHQPPALPGGAARPGPQPLPQPRLRPVPTPQRAPAAPPLERPLPRRRQPQTAPSVQPQRVEPPPAAEPVRAAVREEPAAPARDERRSTAASRERLLRVLGSRAGAEGAFALMEVLGPPLALREERP